MVCHKTMPSLPLLKGTSLLSPVHICIYTFLPLILSLLRGTYLKNTYSLQQGGHLLPPASPSHSLSLSSPPTITHHCLTLPIFLPAAATISLITEQTTCRGHVFACCSARLRQHTSWRRRNTSLCPKIICLINMRTWNSFLLSWLLPS